jgi:hypothetical protein
LGVLFWFHWPDPSFSSRYAYVSGTIERAKWVASGAAGGPTQYLQVTIEGDPRGFITSAQSVSGTYREAFRDQDPRIPALEGREATIVVDSSLRKSPDTPTPYMLALRVDGGPIAPLDAAEDEAQVGEAQIILLSFLGTGMLVGVGLTGGSLQHVYVCFVHR